MPTRRNDPSESTGNSEKLSSLRYIPSFTLNLAMPTCGHDIHRICSTGTNSIKVISVGQLKRIGGSPLRRLEPAPAETFK